MAKLKSDEIGFEIDALTPSTLSMSRLAKYLEKFSALVGNDPNVHFKSVISGCALLKAKVDQSAIPKVKDRAEKFNSGAAPNAVKVTYQEIDVLLLEDESPGRIKLGPQTLYSFTGGKAEQKEELGPVRRTSEVDGQIFAIGGRDETISVQLRDRDKEIRCTVSVPLAKTLSQYLFGPKLRLKGHGNWYRVDGKWAMRGNFIAHDFAVLNDVTLQDSINRIRTMLEGVDPAEFMETMDELRHG